MTNGAAALFMRTAYQNAAVYFGDTPLVVREFTHALSRTFPLTMKRMGAWRTASIPEL